MSKKTFFIFFAVVAVGLLGFQLLLPKPVHAYLPTGGGSGGGVPQETFSVQVFAQSAGSWNQGDIRAFKVQERQLSTGTVTDITNSATWNYSTSQIQFIGMDNNGNAVFLNTKDPWGFSFTQINISASYTQAGETETSAVVTYNPGSPSQWSFYPQTLPVSVVQGSSATVSVGVNHPAGWTDAGVPATTVSVNLSASSLPNGLSFSYSSSQFPGYVCVANGLWCTENGVDNPLPTTITASSNMAPGTYYVFGSGTVENNSPTKYDHTTLTDLGTAYLPIVVTVMSKPVINLTVNPTSISTNGGDSFTINLYENGVQVDPSDPNVSTSSSAFIH